MHSKLENKLTTRIQKFLTDKGWNISKLGNHPRVRYSNIDKLRNFVEYGKGSLTTKVAGRISDFIDEKEAANPEMKTIYISGPISGLEKELAQQKFQAAEHFLKSQNFNVINPMKLDHSDHGPEWNDFMRVDLQALLYCSHIYMLKGHEESRGAAVEMSLAIVLDIHVILQE